MPAHCVVLNCTNGTHGLNKWRNLDCEIHGGKKDVGRCVCAPPFVLYTLPTELADPYKRKEWINLVNRQSDQWQKPGATPSKQVKKWEPKGKSRVCSRHFVNGCPSDKYPNPILHMGYEVPESAKNPKRSRPVARDSACKKRRLDTFQHQSKGMEASELKADVPGPQGDAPLPDTQTDATLPDTQTDATLPDTQTDATLPGPQADDPGPGVKKDHDYLHHCDCKLNCDCIGCVNKQEIIMKLDSKLRLLKSVKSQKKNKNVPKRLNSELNSKLLKSDKAVKLNTGLPTMGCFQALVTFFEPHINNTRYWAGPARVVSSKVKRAFKKTPQKSGPSRKLSVENEILLVLMKLRLALNNTFLADLFGISDSLCSTVITTLIKVLARELKPLIFWPDKVEIQKMLPKSMAEKFPNLRCTIDCSETFISRPRDLNLQAATWSDYKKHNTLKYLVGIAPNGHISFISKAWGGRATDRHITQQSGFLDLIDPGDTIMADRGFTIKEDLMFKFATLEIPPPSSGLDQMSGKMVQKTKKIANARIHVERAIGRLKWFKIMHSTLPVNMIHHFDDILVICAALCNLLPPLVV